MEYIYYMMLYIKYNFIHTIHAIKIQLDYEFMKNN